MNSKPIQPLKLNYQKFRAEFCRLSKMTTYARAMDRATDIKAAKWMDYTPLSKMQLLDDLQPAIVTVRIPINAGNGVKRSTYRGAVYAQATLVWRPTEDMAVARALGFPILDIDMLFERHIPIREVRYCVCCKRTRDLNMFSRDKHNPGGYAFWCKECRLDHDRRIWRIAV